MQIPIISRRGQNKPYGSLPRINPAHPLARGLDFYCYLGSTGNRAIDLVSGQAAAYAGNNFNSLTALGYSFDNNYAVASGSKTAMVFPAGTGTKTSDRVGGGDFTIAAALKPHSLTDTTGSTPEIFGQDNTGDANFAGLGWVADASKNPIITGFGLSGTATAGSSCSNLYTTGAVTRAGATLTTYANNTNGLATSASTDTGTIWTSSSGVYFNVFGNPASPTVTESSVQQQFFWTAMWARALSQTEIVQLHNDPYCFLIFPEDEIFATLVGVASGGNVFNVSATEAATASDAESVVAVFAPAISETGIAVDSPSAIAVFVASDTEAGTATDTPTAGTSTPAAITESATAADAETVTAVFAPSITEAGTATDTDVSTATFVSSQAEAGTATDSPSASAVFAVSDTEAATATDSENTSFNDSVTEAAAATEAETATVVFAATATEAGTATDTPTVAAIFAAAMAEAGIAVDTEVTTAVFVASDTEAATAADTANGTIPGPPDLSTPHFLPFFATVGSLTSLP